MKYVKDDIEKNNILCIPFEKKYFQQYMKIYNDCFYEMRKALDIEPYNFLNDYEQINLILQIPRLNAKFKGNSFATTYKAIIMNIGKNLQFLRKICNGMTQEELAEKIGVSRQTISKWELNTVYPELDKIVELCRLFSCSMDQLVREDISVGDEAYSNIRMEEIEPFDYVKYTVISMEPEEDAINHVRQWARELNVTAPKIIGWDFPAVSQEQINVFNMHGYTAALILRDKALANNTRPDIIHQEKQKYMAITIGESAQSPFYVIPNAYKVLMTYMKVNGIKQKEDKKIISCFEREYEIDGVWHMDVYIAVE